MTKMFNNYIGKAGQLFAMSEFLMLGWNVAIPEVDRGDDIFVVKDEDGELRRVQVKTSQTKPSKNGYYAQFSMPRIQLKTPVTPELHFLFLVRNDTYWSDLLVITRADLYTNVEERLERSEGKSDKLTLKFNFSDNKVLCGKIDFSACRDLTSRFPQIQH